jgi:hypothetical protein
MGEGRCGNIVQPAKSTHHPSPETTPFLPIENRRENFTGRILFMSLTLSIQRLLNVSGQIVTNRGLN